MSGPRVWRIRKEGAAPHRTLLGMAAAASPPGHIIIHLPINSPDWASIATQLGLVLSGREGRAFATWATERLLRLSRHSEGFVALADGSLLGLLLLEHTEDAAELSLPWTRDARPDIAEELVRAALQTVHTQQPAPRYIRAERQILPGQDSSSGLVAAGFQCHQRRRMTLELPGWEAPLQVPAGYRLATWSIRDVDAAAQVVYRANLGTLDALLYAPFFGDSPAQCRKGLLAILAGRYGPIHPQATLTAFRGKELVGVNLVINEGHSLASVVEISVDPDHQGIGLGRALLVRSLQILQHENMDRVELAVTRANTRAASLYESLGFFDSGDFCVCVYP